MLMASSEKAAAHKNSGIDNERTLMEISRLFFALSRITQAVAAQIAFEREEAGEEATDAAERWVKTKTITWMLNGSGNSDISVISLSDQDVDGLQEAAQAEN